MRLRRWLVVVALVAVVLSTLEVGRFTPSANPRVHFRYAILGRQGTPLYLHGHESRSDWRYHLSLTGRIGWGLHYLDDAAGRRIVLGEATDPYDLVPAIWIQRRSP